jgi:uncharacterized Fe-S cluster protein YjdI
MEAYKNEFTNGEILVTYDPKICTQSEICAKGLADVFRTTVIPWIDPDGAETKQIIAQIRKCPSGALKFSYTNQIIAV